MNMSYLVVEILYKFPIRNRLKSKSTHPAEAS